MDLGDVLLGEWQPLVRTLIVGIGAYVGMLVIVRIGGHRTLAQLNAFDLVVTVALGSTLATVILSQEVSLAQGLLAFALLAALQFLLAWLARRSANMERLVHGEPVLLVHRGRNLDAALRRNRITVTEIEAAVRASGSSTADVLAVVLETNGKISVVRDVQDQKTDAIPLQ